WGSRQGGAAACRHALPIKARPRAGKAPVRISSLAFVSTSSRFDGLLAFAPAPWSSIILVVILRHRPKGHKGRDMAVSQLPADGTTQTASSPYNLLLATFFAAILMSAALLFAVQPMFTKMVLPRLGGAAAVWSVAMVFFQATLLAGYTYAHLLTRFAPGRASVLIHLALLLIACAALPLHLAGGWDRP